MPLVRAEPWGAVHQLINESAHLLFKPFQLVGKMEPVFFHYPVELQKSRGLRCVGCMDYLGWNAAFLRPQGHVLRIVGLDNRVVQSVTLMVI